MKALSRELDGTRDLLALAATDPQRYPCLLESAARGANARWDILFAFPRDSLTLDADGRVRDTAGNECGSRFLDALDAAWWAEHLQVAIHGDPSSRHPVASEVVARNTIKGIASAQRHPPFSGGWMLYLGYELVTQIEPRLRLPRSAGSRVPVALALRCPAAIMIDHDRQRTVLVAEPGQADLLDAMQDDLAGSDSGAFALSGGPTVIAEDDPQRYLAGVARIHEYLRAGDTFQVNLSRQWRASYAAAPDAACLYRFLRQANPAPFAGLLRGDGWAIASSSPERLLEIRAGIAQTRPIAGTRPRIAGEDDAARIRELLDHAKERAEHVMLIDLERNDLGRICMPGSVAVDELMTVESYAHVHHIVSNVRGTLRPGVTPGQAIAAVFPGGTITGCPKVRCMEIIAELEGEARGPYTGALGYLDRDGSMDLNILIRSLLVEGSEVSFRAGAGIVADSDAIYELEETRAKARGLLRALAIGA